MNSCCHPLAAGAAGSLDIPLLLLTGLTISREQRDFAVERIRKAGLQDRVDIRLQDYRDEKGTYDGIASIEMFEAVGEKYWPVYFERLKTCLKPGKKAVLQIILVKDERFEAYRKSVDFIQKLIAQIKNYEFNNNTDN